MELNVQDIRELCRVCLKKSFPMKQLHEKIVNQDSVYSIIKNYTTLKIQDSEYFPKFVCSSCEHQVLQIYKVGSKLERTLKHLEESLGIDLNALNKISSKTENGVNGSQMYSKEADAENIYEEVDLYGDLDDDQEEHNTKEQQNHSENGFLALNPDSLSYKSATDYGFVKDKENSNVANTHVKDTQKKKTSTVKESSVGRKFEEHPKTKTKDIRRDIFSFLSTVNNKTSTVTSNKTSTNKRRFSEPERNVEENEETEVPPLPPRNKKTKTAPNRLNKTLDVQISKCNTCGQIFEDTASLQNHKHNYTDCNRTFLIRCSLCNQKINVKEYKRHLKTHAGTYSCPHCPNKFFFNISKLNEHKLTHVSTNSFARFQSVLNRYDLQSKLSQTKSTQSRSAENEKLLQSAKRTQIAFSTLKNLKKSVNKNVYTCALCNTVFPTVENLTQHLKQPCGSARFSCNVCGRKFWSHSSKAEHMKYVHKDLHYYVCKLCSKRFHKEEDLKKHVDLHIALKLKSSGDKVKRNKIK